MTYEPGWVKPRGARQLVALLALAICNVAVGCSGDGYRSSIVTGMVTYKGRPVHGVGVQFAPVDGHRFGRPPAIGITGTDGRYTLVRPGNKPGTAAGPTIVTFSVIEGEPSNIPSHATIGRKFEVDVQPGTSVHDFKL